MSDSESEDEDTKESKRTGRPKQIKKDWDDMVQILIGVWEKVQQSDPEDQAAAAPSEEESLAADKFILRELGPISPSSISIHGWM